MNRPQKWQKVSKKLKKYEEDLNCFFKDKTYQRQFWEVLGSRMCLWIQQALTEKEKVELLSFWLESKKVESRQNYTHLLYTVYCIYIVYTLYLLNKNSNEKDLLPFQSKMKLNHRTAQITHIFILFYFLFYFYFKRLSWSW